MSCPCSDKLLERHLRPKLRPRLRLLRNAGVINVALPELNEFTAVIE